MAVALPTDIAPNGAQPLVRRFGGVLTPFLGGPEQNVNRMGTRLGIRVTMPPMRGPYARQFVARLLRAQESRVVMEWPLLDFDPGNPGGIHVQANVAGGSAIPVQGLTPGYQVSEGQFFSIIHSGRRYMHMSTGAVTAGVSGGAALAIWPMLRTPLTAGDTIEMAQPMIEGNVSPGDELAWTMALEHTIGISFSVIEAA